MTGWVLALALLGPPPAAAPAPAAAPEEAAPAEAGSEGATVVSEGPIAIRVTLRPDPSSIGDVLTLEIVAAYPRGYAVNLPHDLSLAPLHVVDRHEGEPEPTGENLRKTFRVELQRFDVGPATVPAFTVTYVADTGEVHTLEIPSQRFTVESLLANEPDPQRKGEDPPVSIEYPDTRAEIVIWSALATLLAALIAWRVVRRLRARVRPVYVAPPEPAHEVALRALATLRERDLVRQGQVGEYYVELTEIAKAYLEGRFGVLALDRTTDEIRSDLVRRPDVVTPLSAAEVVQFLDACDLVKFARFSPEIEDTLADLERAQEFVERSRPDRGPAERPAGPEAAARRSA